MYFRTTKAQTLFLLKQKETLITFFVLFVLVSINFVGNVLSFRGYDVMSMFHPMKLLSLSYNRIFWNADITLLIVQLYPLLVVLPAGFSLAREHQTGESIFLVSRVGGCKYTSTKLLAALCSTTIVFSTPFLIEILLNCISFPLAAMGDLSNLSIYDTQYILGVNNYLFSNLFLKSAYLYAIVLTILFGFVSGVLSMFTVAISMLVRVKYRAFLCFPVLLLLYGTLFLPLVFKSREKVTAWYHYIMLFNEEPKYNEFFFLVLLFFISFSVCVALYSGRKDHLK